MSTPIGFVGREPELRVLEEQLAIAATGHPQIVFLEGEAGVGQVDFAGPVPHFSFATPPLSPLVAMRRRRFSPMGSSISCSPAL